MPTPPDDPADEIARAYGHLLRRQGSLVLRGIDESVKALLDQLDDARRHHDEHHVREQRLMATLTRISQHARLVKPGQEAAAMKAWSQLAIRTLQTFMDMDAKFTPLGPLAEKAQQRPDGYAKLTPALQWAVDKDLGLLDWDGDPSK